MLEWTSELYFHTSQTLHMSHTTLQLWANVFVVKFSFISLEEEEEESKTIEALMAIYTFDTFVDVCECVCGYVEIKVSNSFLFFLLFSFQLNWFQVKENENIMSLKYWFCYNLSIWNVEIIECKLQRGIWDVWCACIICIGNEIEIKSKWYQPCCIKQR